MERAEVAANWAANVAPVVAHFGGSIGLIKTVQVGARTTRTCARANVLREPPSPPGGGSRLSTRGRVRRHPATFLVVC